MSPKTASLTIGKAIREVRFYVCEKAPGSTGLREFLTNHYWSMKNNNPIVSILVRECDGIMPKFVTRNDTGVERTFEVPAMNQDKILQLFRQQTQT